MYFDILVKREEKSENFKNIYLGKLPIMIGSKYCNLQEPKNECPHDPGGYFIVTGSEKVVIAQEKMNNNQVYTFAKKNIKYIEI